MSLSSFLESIYRIVSHLLTCIKPSYKTGIHTRQAGAAQEPQGAGATVPRWANPVCSPGEIVLRYNRVAGRHYAAGGLWRSVAHVQESRGTQPHQAADAGRVPVAKKRASSRY
jgi:hypothetical protein